MTCADLARIINSDQIQTKLREMKTEARVHDKTKKNPLKNKAMMQKINPYSKTMRELEQKAQEARVTARQKALAKKKSKAGRKEKAKRTDRFNKLARGLENSFADAQKILEDEIKAGLYKLEEDEEDEDEEDDDE